MLRECSVREIEKAIDQPFFDSLRESYPGFNDWFVKCSRENRKCYLLEVENNIVALLIYHIETIDGHQISEINGNALKMCTLKVAETAFGYRLGELFLKKMFELGIRSSIPHIYLTVFPHHNHLIDLLSKYGFEKRVFVNKDGDEELRMIKILIKPSRTSFKQAITSHPFYFDDESVNKFVIPINPMFYNTLFKDGGFRVPTLFDISESSLNEIEGNTISKAYLCKSKSLAMKSGDLLFFYGSKTIKSIEPIGVLDNVIYTKDIKELKELVKRKTVYSDEQLEEMLNGKKEVTVLVFRLLYYLSHPIKHNIIKTLDSYANNFQTITMLSESDYRNLKLKKYFDERFIIN